MTPEFPGQFRLSRIQLVNWGTFNGATDIAVPRRGVLVTGASGSGKSSLLDAIAAVMVQPRWLAFNAAAQQGGQGDRSRSVLSYVRGAHRRDVDESTGQVTTAYLRTGATWSGIALTFDDAAGRVVSLVRLFHAPQQATGPGDVRTLYLDADETVELVPLEPLVANGIDSRGIKAAHPGWAATKNYSGFANRLQRKLGLASDQAQRLLHKTQSAKNLGNLNALLRDFMLDEPDTFALADQAVDQFEELSAAHRAVVEARDQVAALAPLEGIEKAHRQARETLALLDAEQHHAETFFTRRRIETAAALIARHQATLDGLRTEITAAERREHDATAATLACRDRISGLGGDRIPVLERLLGEHEATVSRRRTARSEAEQKAGRCDVTVPGSAREWSDWTSLLDSRIESLDRQDAERAEITYQAQRVSFGAHDEVQRLTDELRTLESQHSNMEPALLRARAELADGLGVEASTLPFAGELIDVDSGQSGWQGAIERVLRPLARTLLVPDALYSRAAAAIDRRNWGTRLVWERVRPDTPAPTRAPARDTLPGKVSVAVSSPFAGWLTATIARRYDYRCVDDVAEFGRVDRALTRAGQIKHSSTRHEKDDRWPVSDRTRWLLGSSTEAKREALRSALDDASAQNDKARIEADRLAAETRERQERRHDLSDLRRLGPDDVDVAAAEAEVSSVTAELDQLRAGNRELALAEAELKEREETEQAAKDETLRLQLDAGQQEREITTLTDRRDKWQAALRRAEEIPEQALKALEARTVTPTQRRGRSEESLDLEDIDHLHHATSDSIGKDRSATQASLNSQVRLAENHTRRFKERWPQRAADLQIGVDYLPEYLRLLDQLRGDRLPEFETRFFDLLQSQSRNNITGLSSRIRTSRREVRNRIDPINESLMRTEYSPGAHLQVKVSVRHLPEVRDFLAELQDITADSVSDVMEAGDDPEARRGAEERFLRIQRLMARFRSQELADRKWRDLCLDTRQHVEFRAEVIDADARPIDFYEDAGGRSGGERQKFVTFCLAAALRYQLARDGAAVPQYGLVALDEAFDKTDPEFTRAGLEVFRSFGFQLLLATPMKMLQTLEDYVGGVILFQNEPGHESRVLARSFDETGTDDAGEGSGDAGGTGSPEQPVEAAASGTTEEPGRTEGPGTTGEPGTTAPDPSESQDSLL